MNIIIIIIVIVVVSSINSPISPALHKPGLLTKFPRSSPFQVLPTLAEEHARLMWHGHDDGDEDHDVVIAAFARSMMLRRELMITTT